MFRRRMICRNCGRRYFTWHDHCSTCSRSNVIVVNPKFKPTLYPFLAAVSPIIEAEEEKKNG